MQLASQYSNPPDQAPWHGAVAIYARLSQNPDGSKDSVSTQLKVARKHCAKAWPGRPVVEFSDDGVTAADNDIHRLGYEQMLAAIRLGQVGAVVAAEQSRITRTVDGWEQFRVVCLSHGIEELDTFRSGVVGLAAGKSLPGRLIAVINSEYVETARVAIKSALAEKAANGEPPPGRIFGYLRAEVDGVKTLRPDPAVEGICQEIAERFLSGESQYSIVDDMNRRKVPRPETGTVVRRGPRAGHVNQGIWTIAQITAAIKSPTRTGLRIYRGEVIGEGNWPAIVDRDTYHAVQAKIAGRVRHGARTPRRYLLTGGIADCALCGTQLVASRNSTMMNGEAAPAYRCSPNHGGCNRISIAAEPFEAQVVEQVLEILDRRDVRARLSEGDPYEEQRAALVQHSLRIAAERTELAADGARGVITYATFKDYAKALDNQAEEVAAEIEALPPVPSGFNVDDALELWPDMSLAAKREIIRMVISGVVVFKARGALLRYDDQRIRVIERVERL